VEAHGPRPVGFSLAPLVLRARQRLGGVEGGRPLEGATVRFGQPGQSQSERVTGEDGRFGVGRVHAPFEVRLVLTVTKEGFRPYRQEISSRRPEDFPGTVVLQPEPRSPRPKE
jgi:hypothetical protein